MYKSNRIKLISVTYRADKIGQEIETKQEKNVYCDIENVTQSEYHNAGRNGLKPEFKLVLSKYDYSEEKIVELDGVQYAIYRTYSSRKNDDIELYVTKKGGIACQQ